MSPFPSLHEPDRNPADGHICWVMNGYDDQAAVASLLAGARLLAEQPVVLAPSGSGLLAGLDPSVVVAADPFAGRLPDGPDPAVLVRVLRDHAARAAASGLRGVRLITDMDWLRGSRPDPGAMAAYEALLGGMSAELGLTTICAYRHTSFEPDVMAGVLAMHAVLHGHAAEPQFRFVASGARQWRLAGEVDFKVSAPFGAAFHAAVKPGGCAVSLHELDFIDLSGVRAIASAAAAAAGLIELHGAPPVFARYWQVCDFGRTAGNVRLQP